MKNLFIILLITTLTFSCGKNQKGKKSGINKRRVLNNKSEFRIIKDTFNFSVNGILKRALEVKIKKELKKY